MDATAVWVVAVVFVATLIRSAFGFGEALVAVPLLALFLPVKTAAPLAVLVSITIAAVVVAQDWRKIHVRSVGWLVVSTMIGTPVGLMLLASRHQRAVMVTLAVLIMAFSVFSLVGKKPPELKADSKRWILGSGFLAGVLGGAYGMNGPPLVILWGHASLVCTAFSRHPAGLLFAGEHYRHVRLLADRAVGSCCDAILSAVPAGVAGGDLARKGDESPHARRSVPEVCVLWVGGHRGDVARAGDATVDERIKE